MEKFDIIIKLQVQDTSIDNSQQSDSYYLPCMIANSPSIKSIRDEFIANNSNDVMTPWLVLEFIFLPFAFFNHILFHFIRKYKVCKVESIYRGKAVFYLDELSRFIICFSHNCISVQIWKWGFVEDNVYRTILNELCDNIESIQEKLRQNISYSMKAKCSTGDYTKKDGRITLTDFISTGKYFCKEHRCPHNMEDMINTWLKHAAEREERNIIRKEPEIALHGPLGADKVKAENEGKKNIIRKEPETALHESLGADKVKAEGEKSNIIRKEPALPESLGADKVKDMNEKKPGQKGLVLIVNFPFHGQRLGSEVDVKNLSEFFEKELRYEVKCSNEDLSKKELEDYFQEIARIYLGENSNDYHSFICVIMSHGNEKGILIPDGVISVAEIKKTFTNKFNGKPKIFLINSSRGNRITGTLDEPSTSSKDNSYVLSFPSEIGSVEKDIIVAYATQPGFVAYRNVHSGSFFINAFISVAKKTYRDEHIEDIFRNMNRELVTNPEYTTQYGKRQIPVVESTFTKIFFL